MHLKKRQKYMKVECLVLHFYQKRNIHACNILISYFLILQNFTLIASMSRVSHCHVARISTSRTMGLHEKIYTQYSYYTFTL